MSVWNWNVYNHSVYAELINGSLRLNDGRNSDSAGRLEVYNSGTGRWGTVCNVGWGESDAKVACRQLGFDDNVTSYLSNEYTVGRNSPVSLSNVRCFGNETSLLACPQDPIGMNTCSHSQDVAIVCDTAVGKYLTWHHLCTSGMIVRSQWQSV